MGALLGENNLNPKLLNPTGSRYINACFSGLFWGCSPEGEGSDDLLSICGWGSAMAVLGAFRGRRVGVSPIGSTRLGVPITRTI